MNDWTRKRQRSLERRRIFAWRDANVRPRRRAAPQAHSSSARKPIMPAITFVQPGFYRLPLPRALTDSTHGEMRAHDVTVHLLAAVPNGTFLEAHGFGLDTFIAEPLRIEEGQALAPDRPGHGIEFDWDRLSAICA
jgi:hypothetical protein